MRTMDTVLIKENSQIAIVTTVSKSDDGPSCCVSYLDRSACVKNGYKVAWFETNETEILGSIPEVLSRALNE